MISNQPRFLVCLCLFMPVAADAAPAAAVERHAPFELSRVGSGRATAYPPTNKIVTRDDRTHVTWLDSAGGAFHVRIRTLDRSTGEWSPVWMIGQAQDNHGGAALTVDAAGYLHALYYPHHEAMRYRRSLRPNDASEWGEEEVFGQDLTYPVVMVAKDDTLWMTARRSYDGHQGFTPPAGSRPWETELWRRRPGEDSWQRVGPLLRARFPGYAQFAEAYWWGDDHQTLHLACRIYETDYHGDRQLFTTVGYLVSRDGGTTWQRRDGTPVMLPATSDTLDVIARGGTAQDNVLMAGGVITDQKDRVQVLFSVVDQSGARTLLATGEAKEAWRVRDLAETATPLGGEWELILPGGITRSDDGGITVVATVHQVPPGSTWWAHPSDEVVRLYSPDHGATFSAELLTHPDPTRPRWLPNLERATGHHAIPRRPGIVFTDGEAGTGNDQILHNRVFWTLGTSP